MRAPVLFLLATTILLGSAAPPARADVREVGLEVKGVT